MTPPRRPGWVARRGQSGMTFIELVIGIALTLSIIGVIAVTLVQMFNMNMRNTNNMTAVRNAQAAGYSVTRDAEMSKTVQVTFPPTPTFLTLTWTDPANYAVTHTVIYTLETGTLWRKLDAGAKIMVANGIALPAAPTYAGGKLVFNVTATAGTPPRAGTETRRYEVTPRPGVQ